MLGTVFTILGLLIILASVASVVGRVLVLNSRNSNVRKPEDRTPLPIWKLALQGSFGIFVGIISIFMNSSVFYAEPGYQYLVQYPNGTQVPVFEPGYHFRWWGNVIDFKQVLSVVAVESHGTAAETSGSYAPLEVRFNDAVKAHVEVASRFRLPHNPEQFRKLAVEYRTQENLINATLLRHLSEVTRNSARMFSAQDYVSGKGGEFETAVLDQMRDGVYELNITENEIRGDEDISHVTDDRTVAGTNKRVRLTVSKAVNKDGIPLRKENPITTYGIEVTQCTISNVIPEQMFQDMLAKQRDAAARASVERQEAQTAGFQKMKIVAQGEASKAETRVAEEKLQIQKLIVVETQMKEEQTRLETEKIKLAQADLQAQQTERLAKAEAFKRKAILDADNALSIRLDTLRQIHAGYAESFKDKQLVPSIVIGSASGGSNGSSAMNLIELMTAKFAKDLAVDLDGNRKEAQK